MSSFVFAWNENERRHFYEYRRTKKSNLNKKGNKVIKIKIDFNDENFQFVQDLQTYLFHKLYPTEINFGAVVAS